MQTYEKTHYALVSDHTQEEMPLRYLLDTEETPECLTSALQSSQLSHGADITARQFVESCNCPEALIALAVTAGVDAEIVAEAKALTAGTIPGDALDILRDADYAFDSCILSYLNAA